MVTFLEKSLRSDQPTQCVIKKGALTQRSTTSTMDVDDYGESIGYARAFRGALTTCSFLNTSVMGRNSFITVRARIVEENLFNLINNPQTRPKNR